MRKTIATSLALALATALASAQPPSKPAVPIGMGIHPTPVPPTLLIEKKPVQDELGLTPEQRELVSELKNQFQKQGQMLREQLKAEREGGDQVAPKARVADGSRYLEARRSQDQANEATIMGALKPGQRERFHQIHLQVEGPFAFLRPEVREGLKLDQGQIRTIEETFDKGRREMVAAMGFPAGGNPRPQVLPPEERREAVIAVRKATMVAISQVLTERQRVTYRNSLGEPFDLARLQDSLTAAPAAKSSGRRTSK